MLFAHLQRLPLLLLGLDMVSAAETGTFRSLQVFEAEHQRRQDEK